MRVKNTGGVVGWSGGHKGYVSIRDKAFHASGRGKGKVMVLKYIGACHSSLQDLPSKETVIPEPKLLDFLQSLTHLGKGKYSTPLYFSMWEKGDTQLQPYYPVHLRRGSKQKHLRNSQSRGTG